MFKTKLIISIFIFVTFLIITSVIKNKTRILEKEITNLNLMRLNLISIICHRPQKSKKKLI